VDRAPEFIFLSLFFAYLTLIVPTGLLFVTVPASAYYMVKAIKKLR